MWHEHSSAACSAAWRRKTDRPRGKTEGQDRAECYARRAGGGRWKEGARAGASGACSTARAGSSFVALRGEMGPTKKTGRSASQDCWSAELPLCGTSSAITAIAIAATAIQNQMRFG